MYPEAFKCLEVTGKQLLGTWVILRKPVIALDAFRQVLVACAEGPSAGKEHRKRHDAFCLGDGLGRVVYRIGSIHCYTPVEFRENGSSREKHGQIVAERNALCDD